MGTQRKSIEMCLDIQVLIPHLVSLKLMSSLLLLRLQSHVDRAAQCCFTTLLSSLLDGTLASVPWIEDVLDS